MIATLPTRPTLPSTPFLSCLVQPYYDRPAQSTCHDGHTVLQCACGEDDTVTPAQLWDVRVPLHADLQLSSCCRVLCVMVCCCVCVCVCVCVCGMVGSERQWYLCVYHGEAYAGV